MSRGFVWWTPDQGLVRGAVALTPQRAAAPRRCPECGLVKQTGDFRHRMDRGVLRPESYCRPCERAFDRARKAARSLRAQRQHS
jgi:hypothetical protein